MAFSVNKVFLIGGAMSSKVLLLVMVLTVTGCGTVKGTVGGFLDGAAEDMKTAGSWIKK